MTYEFLFRQIWKVSAHFRSKRMRQFAHDFALTPETTVLDVGGTPFNWRLLDDIPTVTLANFDNATWPPDPRMTLAIADGCDLPYSDKSFDIAFSNSTIEHVGSWERQQAFASEIRRVGKRYLVQTPNRGFPFEPHYLTPFFHWLPPSWRVRTARYGTVWGWIRRPTPERVQERIAEIRLLDEREMRRLFPEATIQRERFMGMTKSLTALYNPCLQSGAVHQFTAPSARRSETSVPSASPSSAVEVESAS